jgi:hypothetical protein
MNTCFNCSPRTQTFIGLGLMACMAATRFHHFGDTLHLPDASWAIFFIAGFYLSPVWLLALMTEAFAIDYASIGMLGTSAFCVTPAYAALIPAYAALWFGGRWTARKAAADMQSLAKLTGAALASTLVAFAISNGAFYWLGGRVAETSLAQFMHTWIDYAPSFLGSTLMYLAVAAVVQMLVLQRQANTLRV